MSNEISLDDNIGGVKVNFFHLIDKHKDKILEKLEKEKDFLDNYQRNVCNISFNKSVLFPTSFFTNLMR